MAIPKEEQEEIFYAGSGKLQVLRVRHHGLGRKVASWLVLGPIGYVLIGRDKKSKTTAEGRLVITNKRIICAGNEYPFDKILAITKKGKLRKSILLTFEKGDVEERGSGVSGGITVEVEIKTPDIDHVFKALEKAKLSSLHYPSNSEAPVLNDSTTPPKPVVNLDNVQESIKEGIKKLKKLSKKTKENLKVQHNESRQEMSTKEIMEKLKELKVLYEEGLITEEEYIEKKKEILSRL